MLFKGTAAKDVSTPKKCADYFFTNVDGGTRTDKYCLQHLVLTLPVDVTAGAADGWCDDDGGTACIATSEAANVALCSYASDKDSSAWTASSTTFPFKLATGNIQDAAYDAGDGTTGESIFDANGALLTGASVTSAAGNVATTDPDASVWCGAAAGPNKSSAALLQGAALAATIAAVAATL